MSTDRTGRPRRPDDATPLQSGEYTTVTLQVVQHAKTHDTSDPQAQVAQLQRGDIVDVLKTDQWATQDGQNWRWDTPILHPTCVFIHMRGVKKENTAKMRRRFREDLTANNIGRLDDETDAEYARVRRWMVHMNRLPQRAKDELRDDKETTIAWDNIKQHVCQKRFTDPWDPEQDDNETPVDESDIPPDPVVPV